MNSPIVLRGYKRRIKGLQRRVQAEKDLNKKLALSLMLCIKALPQDSLARQIAEQDINLLKYKLG